MRRTSWWSSLILVLSLGSGGIGSLLAQASDGQPLRGEVLQLGAPGILDWNAAVRKERLLRASSLLDASGQVPTAVHPPMPVPVMPPPPGLAAPGAPAAPDLPAVAPASPDEPLAPATSASFASLGDNNAAIPPDTHGGVGPTELVTMLNTQYRRHDRSGNPIGGLLSIYGFWVGAGVSPTAPPYGPFDPRVHYDPDIAYGQGRFITIACQAAAQQSSALLMAVSTGSTAGSWYAWKIPVDAANLPGSGVWFDYPTVGFNKKWIVVQVNVFAYPGNAFVESRIYVFDKAALYGGSQGTYTVIKPTPATYGATQVPASSYDAGPDLYFLQRWNPDDAGTGYLRIYRLSGNVGFETFTPLGYPSAPAWSESALGRVDFAPQGPSCGGTKIQTNDSRIQNVVQRNGRLWATHTVFYPPGGTPTRASVQWWQVETDATVLQRGLVDDPGNTRFYAFPSIAVNRNEDAMLGFSSFEGGEPASARYTFRLATDSLGTMQTPSVLKAGEACYFKDGGSGRNRWGDYSATVVDPIDDRKMWTLQEYASSTDYLGAPATNVWGTWWGMLDPTPVLSILGAAAFEGDVGTTTLTFDLALSIATSQPVAVQWGTTNVTASTADGDYVGATGTVTFAPGETTKTIDVVVNGDLKREGDETFRIDIALTAPTVGNATVPVPQAVGTILNDDPDPLISIGDVQVVEGTGAGSTTASFVVALSNPRDTDVTVSYSSAITPGSAIDPADFAGVAGLLTFSPGQVSKTIPVDVVRDSAIELTETFFVDLSAPTGGSLQKSQGAGVILDDDVAKPPVVGLAVVSDDRRNRLQWQNPAWTTAPVGIVVRYNAASGGCTPPATETDGSGFSFPPGVAGAPRLENDPNFPLTNGWEYCYTVFVDYGGGPTGFSTGVAVKARPFLPSKIKWKYFTGTGATTVAPPTVGQDGALVPSNDNFVHAMARGATGGTWPAGWTPANLGSPAQTRSPIVPYGGGSRYFLSTQDGWVHAIDARTGAKIWETQIGSEAGAAPAGIFVAYGGGWDYVLVGTRQASNNRFYALDPGNGAVIDFYPKTGDTHGLSALGAVTGMATVDYGRGQVYFAAYQAATYSLWCLKLGPPSDALQYRWATTSAALGDIDGSPVLRLNRLYVGNINGRLWAVDPASGSGLYYWDTFDGNIKGFPFPDRRNGDVYFVTTVSPTVGRVVAVTDTGSAFNNKWSLLAQKPSTPLLSTATNFLYVGVEQATSGAGVSQHVLSDGSVLNLDLEPGQVVIGAPSLDLGVSPNMLYVGSAAGVIYAVEVPF